MKQLETWTLANGVQIPCVGFGTYKAARGGDEKVLQTAIEVGYRYLDTASFYENEELVGRAIRESGIARNEFVVASKAWKTQMGYRNTLQAFEESMDKLQLDYLDVYLIHWPRPDLECTNWEQLDLESWRALEELYAKGLVRAIGVSNFLPHHLEPLLKQAAVMPMIDQIEFHPGYNQLETVEYCQQRGIVMQGWSPLGRVRMLSNPLLVEIAARYQVSVVQLCLRYAYQHRVMPLPKSSSRERMEQNLDVFGFCISEQDMQAIDTMPRSGWSGEHPDCARVAAMYE